MDAIVKVEHLTQRFGKTIALNDLNLAIPPGAVYGFIGPNGAGKTTTMRILTTLLPPMSGDAWVAGHSVRTESEQVRRVIGFMPDYFGVYESMRVWEYLDFFAHIYGIKEPRRSKLIDELLGLVDLEGKKDSYVMGLSRGMKQRLSLARTMAHDPQLLILDEPASGLDPRARIELRELLRELRRMGKTIMISSHILTELAEMCTHIGIIEQGRLLASGDVASIMAELRPHTLIEIQVLQQQQQAIDILQQVAHVAHVELMEQLDQERTIAGAATIFVNYHGPVETRTELLAALVSNNINVMHFAERRSDLEEIFLQVTKGAVA